VRLIRSCADRRLCYSHRSCSLPASEEPFPAGNYPLTGKQPQTSCADPTGAPRFRPGERFPAQFTFPQGVYDTSAAPAGEGEKQLCPTR